MAAETARGPGRMASVTGHPVVAVRQLFFVAFIAGRRAPRDSVLPQRLGQARGLAVMGIPWRDAVDHLHYFPRTAWIEIRSLIDFAVFLIEPPLSRRSPLQRKVRSTCRRRGRRGSQRGFRFHGPMAIHAVDLDGVARFAIQIPVAVTIALKVTVGAVHP